MNIESFRARFLHFLEERDNKKAVEFEQSGSNIFLFTNYLKEFISSVNSSDVDLSNMTVNDILDMQLNAVEGESPYENPNENSGNDSNNQNSNNSPQTAQYSNDTKALGPVVANVDDIVDNKYTKAVENNDEAENNSSADDEAVNNTKADDEADEYTTKYSDDVRNELDKRIEEDENLKEVLDYDGDGEISDKEKSTFLKFAQGDKDELTVEDLQIAFDEAHMYNPMSILANENNNTDEENPEGTDSKDGLDTEEVEEAASAEKADTTSTGSSSSGVSSYGGGSYNYSPSSSGSTPKQKTLDNMSISELESEKATRESDVSNAQDEVNSVHNGSNEKVAEAKEDYEAKKGAYETAVKNDDNISDELKQRQETNLNNIDQKQGEIDNLEINLNDKNNELTDIKNTIAEDNSTISALESALSELNSYETDDEEKKKEIIAKKSSVESQLRLARNSRDTHEKTKKRLEETDIPNLEKSLDDKKGELDSLEEERGYIEAEIAKNCSPETKQALDAFNEAKEKVETVKADELKIAQDNLTTAEASLEEVNAVLNAKKAKKIENENSPNDLKDVDKLYEKLGLKDLGLSYDVFSLAMEGYNNLEDKGNGLFGIFDTTQGSDAKRYYLIDFNNMEVVGQCGMKIGTGDMSNVAGANIEGSHATLSGYEIISGEKQYYSGVGKLCNEMIGLEAGINDNAKSKGTLVHYASGEYTYGCKGFVPVRDANGNIDIDATYELQDKLFPVGTIMFTYPTDVQEYMELSDLV